MNKTVPSIGFIYKNFAAYKGISHIGLGVSASLNARVLSANVGPAVVIPSRHNIDVVRGITEYNKTHELPLTHIIISAPWLSTRDLRAMCNHFKDIKFLVLSHSNVGFLQADPNGVRLIREGILLSKELPNFKMGGNSKKFVDWLSEAYETDIVLLPNMYPDIGKAKPWKRTTPIKIGCFGAIRPQKNVMTATAAAIAIHQELDMPVDFYVSSGREEGGVSTLLNAMNQMCMNIDGFQLLKSPWKPWGEFKEVVRSMDLLIQVSYTESFNMVTADGISVGVPSVVSDAIDWAPESWKAKSDDALDVAKVGIKLLTKMKERRKGLAAIKKHNVRSLKLWKHYLLGKEANKWGRLGQFFRLG